MKDFDPNAKCPKCGYEEINTNYFEKVEWVSSCDTCRTYNGKQVVKEHLKRMCTRCHFTWPENILKEKLDENN